MGENYFWQKLKRFSNNIALYDAENDREINYSELDSRTEELCLQLKLNFKGLVFLFTSNSIESIVAYIASLKSKNAVLLLDEKLNHNIKKNLIQTYSPNFIITANEKKTANYSPEFSIGTLYVYKKVETILSNINLNLSVLLSTSGTTGSPKLVRLSYRNIQSNAESISEYLHITENERPITTLPLNYSYGLSVLNSHLLSGSSIILTDKSVLFRDFWDVFNKYKCTSFAGVPYTYTMLKRTNFEKMDLPTLKTMTQAGGKLSEEFIKYFYLYSEKRNVKFYVMYGQTEATARISYVPPEKLDTKIGSIGIPIPNGELKLFEEGVEINTINRTAEIVYKGNNVMMGYAEDCDDLKKDDELNGILFTGDLGYVDKDGFFYITGRMKRFIKIFGLRINLDEVQKMVENHFGIPAACTGKDDLLMILIHSNNPLTEINVKNEVLKLYRLNFKSIIVKSTTKIPTYNSGKYNYDEIIKLFS